jgi:hypothetical protein
MPRKEERYCAHHGLTTFFEAKAKNVKGGVRWRCEACARETGKKRRRAIKAQLVQEFGGACQDCGYNKCIGALHFHHLDKSSKSFHVSSRSLEASRKEAQKCALLCANCHYEREYNE